MTSLADVKPFEVHVPERKLERLRQKLALSDFPDDIPLRSESPWTRGPPVSEIKRLAEYWQTSFDWRKVEAHLNSFPQFIAAVEIEGLGSFDIHHIHKKSARPNAIPLLFLHGWPGSFIEVTKMVNDLVRGDESGGSCAFHVVAPSLVDFGFSSASGSSGFLMEHHAEAYDKLMRLLGYQKYVIQAGDVGSRVTRDIIKRYGSTSCKAYHTNTPVPAQPDAETHPELHAKVSSTPLTEAELKGLERAGLFQQEGFGYFKQQSTKPLTLGYSLRDSPVGMLAWIYEKLVAWSDDYPWTDEEILTWVCIYYFSTPGPDASVKVYYTMEHDGPSTFASAPAYIDVPFGIARFRNDIFTLPKLWNHTLGPLVFDSEYETGGHFAAWERPDAIVKDLRSMFSKGGSAYEHVRYMVEKEG